MAIKWSQEETDFLVDYYLIYGPKLCAEKLGKTIGSVCHKANRMNIRIRGWSNKDLEFLKNNFRQLGPSKCAKILNKKKGTVQAMARKLGLVTDIQCGHPKKKVIAIINDKRVIMACNHHGCVEFYVRPNGRYECLICRRVYQKRMIQHDSHKAKRRKWVNARRQTKLGNYEHRLRGLLRYASRGAISYTKDLQYSSKELCDHLEHIRFRQANRCPMCETHYDDVGYDIDHVIPTSLANSKEELLQLFALENLSLLCPRCNRHVKSNTIMDIRYGK